VSTNPPFSNIGVDFAGPLYLKKSQSNVTKYKVYVCLFTCVSTRALHLEIVRDMSTSTFLQAFHRFCGHRGVPSVIISDSAKTFQAGSKEIHKIIRSEPVQQYLTNHRISWKFIIEKGPWWGDF